MPTLPDVSSLGARPVPVNRQGIARQDTTAAGMGMAQIGNVIGQIGEEIQKKNDEQAVFEARRKLDQWERDTLYDPEKGVASKRGVDALDLPSKIPGEYDKFASQVGETLSSNRQRQVFQEMAQSRRNQVADFTIRHALTQKEVYEKGQLNADMIASSDRAVLLASNGDPAAARAELAVSGDRLTSFMKARGASGEEIALALKTTASGAHEAAVRAMVNKGDPTAAQAYLEANAGSMLEKDKAQAMGLLKEGALRVKSQTFADEVMSSSMDMGAALAEARKRFKGDEEVAATHEVKTRFAEQEAVKAQAVKQVSTDAWSVLMEKGSMSAIPASMMEQLRTKAPEEERQMRDWLEQKWRRAKADAENKDIDPQVFYGLRMMAAENPEAFAKLDILKSAPYLSKQHESQLIELQAGIGKGDLKAMESQATVKRTIGMLKAEIGQAGIDLTLTEKDKNSAKAKETVAFMGAVTQALDEATASKGRPLTNDEAKKIGLGMLREGIEQGSGIFGIGQTRKRGYQIATDPDIQPGANFVAARFGDIPAAVRNALITDYRAAKNKGSRALTTEDEQAIERAYTRGVNEGRFK
jgi:hypothetical protein